MCIRDRDQANAISRKRFGRDLADASEEQQFAVVGALEHESNAFFELVLSLIHI